jgi:hypothetical protein
MKRTHKLLAAFVPPVVAGVAVGVCGGCGSNRSTDNAPTSELNVPKVREKKADNDKDDIDKGAVVKAAKEILAVLPTQLVDRSKWVTKDDLSKKLPKIKPDWGAGRGWCWPERGPCR